MSMTIENEKQDAGIGTKGRRRTENKSSTLVSLYQIQVSALECGHHKDSEEETLSSSNVGSTQ